MKRTLTLLALALLAAGMAFGQVITVTQPAGGSFAMGAACPVHWTASGISGTVKIQLIRPGGGLVGPIANRLDPGSSPYNWTVAAPAEAGGSYRIRVSATDGSAQGESGEFTVSAGEPGEPSEPGTPGSISNVRLSGASPHRIGDPRTISWSAPGVAQPIKLQLIRSGGALVGAIANSLPAGTTSHAWSAGQYIGGTAEPGENYKIRVSTVDNALTAESPTFALSNFLTVMDLVLTPAIAVRDLELKSVRHVLSRGGWIVARVKNHVSAIDMDVSYRLTFPEGGGPGAQTISRRLTLAAGAEGDVYLQPLTLDDLPLAGLLTRVMVDGPVSQIDETNEGNNTREARLTKFDISCSAPRSELQLSRLYMQDKDFRVRFKIHVRHNQGSTLHNIQVEWTLYSPDRELRTYSRTIESLAPGAEYVWSVDEKYDKTGSFAAQHPTLSEGTLYRAAARIVTHDDYAGNNSSGFSFSFPD